MLTVTVVAVAVAIVLAIVLERQIVARAPREAERRLTAWLGVPTAVVAVGRPRDWLRHRRVPAVSLLADQLPIAGTSAVIDRLEVELVGVRTLGRGADRQITTEGGRFRATLGEEQVRHLVDLPPLVRRLDLRGSRVRLVTSTGLVVDLQVQVVAGAIELKPVVNPLGALLPVLRRIALPNLPAGATIESVVVRDGQLVAQGPIAPSHDRDA